MNPDDAGQIDDFDDALSDVAAGRSEVFAPFGHSPGHTPEVMAELYPDSASAQGYAEPTRDWSGVDSTVAAGAQESTIGNSSPETAQAIGQSLSNWLANQTSNLVAPQDVPEQLASNASTFIDTDSASASDATAVDDSLS